MTDIVEWLRGKAKTLAYADDIDRTREAADEIERLREAFADKGDWCEKAIKQARNDALEEAAKWLDDNGSPMHSAAIRALKEKP